MTLLNRKPLHLACNLEQLDEIVNKRNKIRASRLEVLLKLAQRLFDTACSFVNIPDEELQYVYYTRFVNLMKDILGGCRDASYIHARFGRQLAKAEERIAAIKQNLKKRYAENSASKMKQASLTSVRSKLSKKSTTIPKESVPIFKSKFITPEDLYEAYKKKESFIVWDARPRDDYERSRLKELKNINIPHHIIKPGFSANVLSHHMPTESIPDFNNRGDFKYIILMDWKTDEKAFSYSVLSVLASIISNWDSVIYKNPPFILTGGFLAWANKYPTFCTDPKVYFDHFYEDLDDLLGLENLSYSSMMLINLHLEEKKEFEKRVDSFELQLAKANSLIEYYNMLYNVVANSDISQIALEDRLESLEKIGFAIAEEASKSLFDYRSPFYSQGNIEQLRKFEEQLTNLQIECTTIKDKILNLAHLKFTKNKENTIAANVKDAQVELKKRVSDGSTAPKVDRKCKPIVIDVKLPDLLKSFKGANFKGLTGLFNIHNTCYQNTLIQCLRHLPSVAVFFLKKQYSHFLLDRKVKIIDELGETIEKLWLSNSDYFNPRDFYEKIVYNIDAVYGHGSHEDIHQFFLSLIDTLVEDTRFKVFIDESAPPSTKSWYSQLEWHASFFTESFFHQIVTRQNCNFCRKRSVKYDMENVFLLSIPQEMENRPFQLGKLMEFYLTGEKNKKVICKNCKAAVDNQRQVLKYPKIAVLCIKRYKLEGDDWNKNEEQCYFPEEITISETEYKLYSIAQHIGTMRSGHYTAACLNPLDNKWWKEG